MTPQRKEACKRYRAKHRELVRQQNRAYYERTKAEKHAQQMEWRVKNRLKRRAHRMVEYALAKGRLQRQPCACGNPKAQAHHHDYNKPLDVTWLCALCHAKEHHAAA